ncbi:hypothetical protein [Burkholderia cenocepacia]|uniref:hypothetical protein n=1 Tax=Burkholderia cenocepacia TaxID=95486 RepID=UPI002AAF8DED|nr:hypothetical protein [Burkholderia cenocepacia]
MNQSTQRAPRAVHHRPPSPRAENLRNAVISYMPSTLAGLAVRLLLSMMPSLVHRSATRLSRLREMLASGSFVVTVTTMQGGGGQLILRDGRLSFSRRHSAVPDLTQTWSSAKEALRALTSSDETDLQRAFVAGHLKMSGSFLPVLWLNEAMKLARGRDSKQVTRFLSRDAA